MSDKSRFFKIVCIATPILIIFITISGRIEVDFTRTLQSTGLYYARQIVGKLSVVLNVTSEESFLNLPDQPIATCRSSQPPANLNVTEYEFNHTKRNCTALMSVLLYPPARGLGNNMFAYASMLGMASDCGLQMCPYVANQELTHLLKVFKRLSVPVFPDFITNKKDVAVEKHVRIYVPPQERELKCDQNYLLMEFYQSWKYFHPKFRNLLKYRDFVFKEETVKAAQQYRETLLNSVLNKHQLTLGPSLYYEFVIIHIRKWPDTFAKNGHLSSDLDSLQKGLKRIRLDFDKYSRQCEAKKSQRLIIYTLLSGDDLNGRDLTANLSVSNLGWKEEFTVATRGDRALDLQLMALSDRVYMSASGSTYSWWGAYLSEAKKIYYNREWAKMNTTAHSELSPADYFLPEWVAV